MVIKKKEPKERITLEQLEEASREEIHRVSFARGRIIAQIMAEKNNSGFYFSVVFATHGERDKWCKAHGLVLTDDEYILAKDYAITIKEAEK